MIITEELELLGNRSGNSFYQSNLVSPQLYSTMTFINNPFCTLESVLSHWFVQVEFKSKSMSEIAYSNSKFPGQEPAQFLNVTV